VQPLFVKWAHPFATELISPDVLKGKQKRKDVVYYPGYHELAYLHPNRFVADESVISDIGLKKGDPFFVLRFNAFKAHHDAGVSGISEDQKVELIHKLSPKGRVLISSEEELPVKFEPYRITIQQSKIHSLMYYATLFIGDSQTMASEAAVLGTPSLRCNSFAGRISYLEEEEHKYGLTFGFKPYEFDQLLKKIDDLLEIPDLKKEWSKRKQRLLDNKIDVTSFWVWFIENYPQSKHEYLKNGINLDSFQ
jgi:predicted glycosyltransferase